MTSRIVATLREHVAPACSKANLLEEAGAVMRAATRIEKLEAVIARLRQARNPERYAPKAAVDVETRRTTSRTTP